MKVIKIDADKQVITEIEIEPTLQGMYAAIGNGCDTIERIPDGTAMGQKGHDMWLDENALFNPDIKNYFALLEESGQPEKGGYVYKGSAIVAGLKKTDDGQVWCDHSMDINQLKLMIAFFTEIELENFNQNFSSN